MNFQLLEKDVVNDDIYSLIFKVPAGFSWQPGQYIDLEVPHSNADSKGTHRWFSISSAPVEKTIMITTRVLKRDSSYKQALSELPIGASVSAGKPRGDFLLDGRARRHIMIAGGIGITPYRSMILQAASDKLDIDVELLYIDSRKQFIFTDELGEAGKKLTFFSLSKFSKRLTETDIKKLKPADVYYLSGPRDLVEAYQTMLEDSGVNDIRTDYFSGY